MKMDERTEDFVVSTLGSVFHACLRQVCDSDKANEAWHAIKKMPTSEWSGVVGLTAVEIALLWDDVPENEEARREMIETTISMGLMSFLRKNTDSSEAIHAWRALRDLPESEWNEVIYWTTDRTYTEMIKCTSEEFTDE